MIKLQLPYGDIERYIEVVKSPCFSLKLDGVRVIATVKDGKVTYISRNGKPYPNFSCFDKYFSHCEGLTLDGEVVYAGGDFSKQMTQTRRLKDLDVSGFRYRLFDIYMPDTTFAVRYEKLVSLFPEWDGTDTDIVSYIPHITTSVTKIKDEYERAIHFGHEGVVFKDWDHVYEPRRTRHWLRIKPVNTEEAIVTGTVEGVGKHKGKLGALLCRTSIDFVVGTGFTDKERVDFWKDPPKMIEFKYQVRTAHQKYRFPVFIRVRDDKYV